MKRLNENSSEGKMDQLNKAKAHDANTSLHTSRKRDETNIIKSKGHKKLQMASPQQDGGGFMWMIWEGAETCRPSFLLSLWFKAVKQDSIFVTMSWDLKPAWYVWVDWLYWPAVQSMFIPWRFRLSASASRRLSDTYCSVSARRQLRFLPGTRSPTPRLWFTAMDISPADCCCNLLRSIGYWSGRPGPAPPRCGEWTTEAVPVWGAKHRYHLQPETFIAAQSQIWVLKNQS